MSPTEVYRQFRKKNRNESIVYYNPDNCPPVITDVFLPSTSDTDGLSLVDQSRRAKEWAAFRPNEPDYRFLLARLGSQLLIDAANQTGVENFEIKYDCDELDNEHSPTCPAHCLATKININAYHKKSPTRTNITQWAVKVSTSVTTEMISGPFNNKPDRDTTPYLPAIGQSNPSQIKSS